MFIFLGAWAFCTNPGFGSPLFAVCLRCTPACRFNRGYLQMKNKPLQTKACIIDMLLSLVL
jgi:hypothetical protein